MMYVYLCACLFFYASQQRNYCAIFFVSIRKEVLALFSYFSFSFSVCIVHCVHHQFLLILMFNLYRMRQTQTYALNSSFVHFVLQEKPFLLKSPDRHWIVVILHLDHKAVTTHISTHTHKNHLTC